MSMADVWIQAEGGSNDELATTQLSAISVFPSHGVRFVDTDGDGCLSAGDNFILNAPPYHNSTIFALARAGHGAPIDVSSGGRYCMVLLYMITPSLSMSKSYIPGGVQFNVTSRPSTDVHWGEVAIGAYFYTDHPAI